MKDNGEFGYAVHKLASARLEDLPLFCAPSVPIATSESAARQIKPHVPELHRKILDTLTGWGPMTCEELCEFLKIPGDTMRPRIWELAHMGKLERSKEKHMTNSGRWAYCYRIKHAD